MDAGIVIVPVEKVVSTRQDPPRIENRFRKLANKQPAKVATDRHSVAPIVFMAERGLKGRSSQMVIMSVGVSIDVGVSSASA